MPAAGIIVLHFSPRELRREPAKVAEMIKGALNRGLSRPPLPIRTVPCARRSIKYECGVLTALMQNATTAGIRHGQSAQAGAMSEWAARGNVAGLWSGRLAFGEGEGHFFYGEQGGDVEGEELAAVHDGLQAAEGGLGGGGGGELAQVGLGVGELHPGA